jgi:hypothetical protein
VKRAKPRTSKSVGSVDPSGGFSAEALRAAGFEGFVTFAALLDGELGSVPRAPGVYVVLRMGSGTPTFLDTSCGGHFKCRDPSELPDVLRTKWIENCSAVYIGKGDQLRRRLREYAKFGQGEPIGHWGGRYIWQLADATEFVVAWREVRTGQTAREAEAELVSAFKRKFGRLPFANIADPSQRRVIDTRSYPNARRLAECALITRFATLSDEEPTREGRLQELRPLVVSTVDDASLAQCVEDIRRGDGQELTWSVRADGTRLPPKLHSIYSSCGGALNLFGPWRLAPASLTLLDETGFAELRLEEELRIFPGGKAPNLDCVVWDDTRILAVESKLCEHLAPGHTAEFRESYEREAPFAHESWAALYDLLLREPDHFVYLDAAQLLRHYLGLRTQVEKCGDHARKRAKLTYLYWEPEDAKAHPACMTHRDEVAEIRQLASDPVIPFFALSHGELWKSWEGDDQPPWLREHVRLLRERYDVPLS